MPTYIALQCGQCETYQAVQEPKQAKRNAPKRGVRAPQWTCKMWYVIGNISTTNVCALYEKCRKDILHAHTIRSNKKQSVTRVYARADMGKESEYRIGVDKIYYLTCTMRQIITRVELRFLPLSAVRPIVQQLNASRGGKAASSSGGPILFASALEHTQQQQESTIEQEMTAAHDVNPLSDDQLLAVLENGCEGKKSMWDEFVDEEDDAEGEEESEEPASSNTVFLLSSDLRKRERESTTGKGKKGRHPPARPRKERRRDENSYSPEVDNEVHAEESTSTDQHVYLETANDSSTSKSMWDDFL